MLVEATHDFLRSPRVPHLAVRIEIHPHGRMQPEAEAIRQARRKPLHLAGQSVPTVEPAAILGEYQPSLVHEPRGEGTDVSPRMPTDEVAAAVTHMQRLWSDVEDLETEHGLTPTGAPDAGIAWAMHRWASGRDLDQVLRGSDLTAGDFVRRCKQVVDLLGQVADAADDAEVRRTARKAMDAIQRGDADAAERTARVHLRQMLTELPHMAARYPEYFTE